MLHRLLMPLAAALILSIAGPAAADSRTFTDETKTAGPMDIVKVSVKNEGKLTLRIVVDDLQKKFGRSALVSIDTNAKRPGPEFAISSGLYESDWSIHRVKNWKASSGPLSCPVSQGLDYQSDVIRWTTGKGCLGKYGKVRASFSTGGAGATDHSPGPKSFHSWVKRH